MPPSEDQTLVSVAMHGSVARLVLEGASRMNSLGASTLRSLREAAARITSDPAVRCVLIAGEGRHFCAGAALDEVVRLRADGGLGNFLQLGTEVFDAIESIPVPVVVAVQGVCLAGGLELVLACDLVVAADDAKFGDQHANFGLVPGWGGAARLVQKLGPSRARELMFLGKSISAFQAMEWGLATQVVGRAELVATAEALCIDISAKSRQGLAAMKRLSGLALPNLADPRAVEIAIGAINSDDAGEGLQAFKERRAPVFGEGRP
jgi:enoyl-CoA hydratase/carnithine racemase